MLDDYHLVDDPDDRPGPDLPGRAPAAAGARRAQHAGRPRPAAGPLAGARRAGRDPRGRPAVQLRRGRRLPRRGDRRAAQRRAGRRPWRTAPRAGSRPCSSPPSRCRGAPTSRPSSPGSPATTATSSTTSSRRCSPTSRSRCATSCWAPRCSTGSPARCATRSLARDDAGAMLQTLERANLFLVAAGRPAGVVPLPPAVRRRAAGPPGRRAARAGAGAAPAREPVVRGARPRRRRRCGTPWRPATSTGPPPSWSWPFRRSAGSGSEAVVPGWLAALPDDTVRRSPVLSVFAAALLMIAGDLDVGRPEARRRGARARRGRGGRDHALARDRGAAHPAVDDRHLPGVPGAGAGRRRGHRAARPARPRPRRPARATSPVAARPASSGWRPGRAAT